MLTTTTEADIQKELQKAPPIDPNTYYDWAIKYRADQATAELSKPPIPAATTLGLLKKTTYDDPKSMLELALSLWSPTGLDQLLLGYYNAPDGKKYFTFLQPQPSTLPCDFPKDASRGDPVVTQCRTTPSASALPQFFLPVGQVCVSQSGDPAGKTDLTDFVLAVGTDRKAYFMSNPLGSDPVAWAEGNLAFADKHDPGDVRSIASIFPGFTTPTTAVDLKAKIEDLCGAKQDSYDLKITAASFPNLPPNTTAQFGSPDAAGWTALDKVSPGFKSVVNYSSPLASLRV